MNYKEIYDKIIKFFDEKNGMLSVLHTELDYYYKYDDNFEYIFYDNNSDDGTPYEYMDETIIMFFEKNIINIIGLNYMHCKKCKKMIYEYSHNEENYNELSDTTKNEMICLCPVAKYRYKSLNQH